MIESEDKSENIDDEDEHISTTVFYHAKKEGCDDDEAERLARAIGEDRYNSNCQRLKRWIIERIKSLSALISAILTGCGIIMAEEILEIIKSLF